MSGNARHNRGFTQVGPLVTVKELKEVYLFGVDIVDNDGNVLPDSAYQTFLNNAIGWLETELDMAIMPRTEPEYKDYHANDYWDWGYFQLNNYPVITLDKLEMTYLRDNNGEDDIVQEIPSSWIRLDKNSGIVRLIPNNTFPASLQVGHAGTFFPELFTYKGMVPQMWKFTYTHGFAAGQIPNQINLAIGYLAAIQALDIAGDLVLGAGIASSSLSLDGLSQSINTTSSAENHAFSAKRNMYAQTLFGKSVNDIGLIQKIRDYFKGGDLQII